MKISYNWLKQYLNVNWEAEKTAELLTDLGLEVEGVEEIESIKGGLKGIVVGEVLTCEKHPNADKLSITTVDLGDGEPVQIVCGAPNVAAGQKVPVATVGTTLYDGDESFKIKKGKIRGEVSLGMICAEDELGLGSSHDGIMVLDSEIKAGTKAAEVFEIESDFMIEIGLTPNRSDAMSHYGVARDLWAGLRRYDANFDLKLPSVEEFKIHNNNLPITVEVENTERAPRYAGVTLTNITVKDSPEWMQNHLKAIGLSPINNVVDVTNYVLHELGQPLHAFDAAKITGNKVVVKTAEKGTKFVTLDEVERELHEEDLMICDAEKPMCIGGVFGGNSSGVSETTTSIFLESAYFNPISVRKSSKRHALSTDASFRFERGIDPNITIFALKRACLLLEEVAGAKVSSEIFDNYPTAIEDFKVSINFNRVDSLIGKKIERKMIKSILSDLEMKIENETEEGLDLIVPAYRNDVTREADIIEDILRVYGYNNIEFGTKLNSSISFSEGFNVERTTEIISNQLSSMGFHEMMANSLTTAKYAESVESYNNDHNVVILNPLSSDLGVMRQSLLFGGLESISHNINRKRSSLKLFEFGKTYHKFESGYNEKKHLAIFTTGNQNEESWNGTSKPTDFFYIKAVAINVLEKFGITGLKQKPSSSDIFQEGITLLKGKLKLAEIGVVKKSVLKGNDIKQSVFYADIDWENVVSLGSKTDVKFQELPKFPEVKRDLALLLDSDVKFADIYNAATQSERKLLKAVNLFDVYEGDKLPAGKKSYAVSFILQDTDKTLVDKVVDKIMSKLINTFEKQFKAELRS
jgi:phenylalanyl-tRNA synthetase beta chain